MTIKFKDFFSESKNMRYTLINVPGSMEYIKNMISGMSQADVLVLTANAEEDPNWNLTRYLVIAMALGIKQVIVAVTKMDKVK